MSGYTNHGFGGDLRLIPEYQPTYETKWQESRTMQYVIKPQEPAHILFNNVSSDRNWGRSMFTPWDTAFYPFTPIETVLQEETPAIPLAMIKQESGFSPLTHVNWSVTNLRPYDNASRKLW